MLSLALILIISCLPRWGIGASAPEPTTTQYVSWQSEPDNRGTWSILSSCVVTLILCVYTAIHMNVPLASRTAAQRKRDLVAWVLTGVFAPELVVWTAWCQWSEARHLTKEIHRIRQEFGISDKDSSVAMLPWEERRSTRRLLSTWTLKHSFFVVMGGYQFHPDTVVHPPSSDSTFFIRTVLSVKGFISLLDAGHGDKLPVISLQDLEDRSKADGLAKFLSCVQGLWLVIQLAGRLISGLVITELEVNTLAHVLCAITMYGFWVQKPLQVTQPVWIEPDGLETWILAHTGLHESARIGISQLQENLTGESDIHLHPDTDFDCSECRQIQKRRSVFGLKVPFSSSSRTIQILRDCPKGRFTIDFVTEDNASSSVDSTPPDSNIESSYNLKLIKLQPSDLDVFLRIWQSDERDDFIAKIGWDALVDHGTLMIKFHYFSSYWRIQTMIAISSCYGGLHASLWQHHFPTTAERWLWRIASLVVAGNGLFALLILLIFKDGRDSKILSWTMTILFRVMTSHGLKIIERSSGTVIVSTVAGIICLQFVFVFCRVFLFVEAFISLRSQPTSAYQSPVWTQWFPHL